MDSDPVITAITLAVSVISLTVSGFIAYRQLRTATDGYALPVVLNVFSQFRSQEFFEAQQYIFHELNLEFESPVAYTDLPLENRSKVRMVAGLYDDLGKLVAHGIVREELIIGSNGTQARRIWEAVAPFVYEERKKRRSRLWIYLEDLAARSVRTPPTTIYERLKLRQYVAPPPAASTSPPSPPAGRG